MLQQQVLFETEILEIIKGVFPHEIFLVKGANNNSPEFYIPKLLR